MEDKMKQFEINYFYFNSLLKFNSYRDRVSIKFTSFDCLFFQIKELKKLDRKVENFIKSINLNTKWFIQFDGTVNFRYKFY